MAQAPVAVHRGVPRRGEQRRADLYPLWVTSGMPEKRRFLRTKFDSRVRLSHPVHGEAIFRTCDVSDGGVYLEKGAFELTLGDEVVVQVQDMPGEAPLVRMRVVRCDGVGYGMQFAD